MTIQAGQIITIGTARFIVDDIRDGHRVGDIALRYTLREGFVKLNGATVLRADYPRLVQWVDENNLWTDDDAALGLFGVGDSLTTMRLPDFRNRFLEGVDSNGGAVVEAGVPNADGHVDNILTIAPGNGGMVSMSYANNAWYVEGRSNGGTAQTGFYFDLSQGNAIFGKSDTVQPAAVRLIAQIKY